MDNLSTSAMNDETWRGIIIRSIPPTAKWLPVIPSLYSMSSAADIISTLLAHGMILSRGSKSKPTSGSSNTALVARTAEGCSNPNCKAKKRSTHTTANCYWPGGGKEGQFPPNFGQRARANVAASTTEGLEHFVLSVCVPDTPGNSGVVVHEEESWVVIHEGEIPIEGDSGDSGVVIHEDGPHGVTSMAFVSRGFQSFGKDKIPTFMDSGASDTMFVSKDAFVEYKATPPRTGDSAKAVDGDFEIVGEGKVTQRYLVDGKERVITYTRALHTPTLNANLISISAFDRVGLTTTFGGGRGVIRKPDGSVVLTGRGERGMYIVDTLAGDNEILSDVPLAMQSLSQVISLEQWHRRLTHCNPSTIQEMASKNLVDGLRISVTNLRGKCEDCVLGRQTRRPFDGETDKVLSLLELVSFDLWGPSRVQSGGGKLYFMPVIDAGTSYKYGAYLADKSDSSTIAAFNAFQIQAESLMGHKIQRLRTDGAYSSAAWEDYCQKHGIVHEFTAPYSSAQNGLAERAIRTTMDDVRTLLSDSGLSHSYWAEAAAFSVETRNLIPSRRHPSLIPLESFSGKRQDVSHLRVFGSRCWAKIPTVNGALVTGGSKLNERGVECRFLGYAGGRGNYKVQGAESRQVFVSRNVIFEEGQPHRTSPIVGENIPLFDVVTPDDGEANNRETNNHDNKHDDLNNHRTIIMIILILEIRITIKLITLIFPSPSNKSLNHGDLLEPRSPRVRVSSPGNTNNAKISVEMKDKTGLLIMDTLKPLLPSIRSLLNKTTIPRV